MICRLLLVSYLYLFCQPAASAALIRVGSIPADSLLMADQEFMARIRQLHHTDVVPLFPRLLEVCPTIAFTIPCIPPVGAWDYNRLSSGFGWRRHPIGGRYKHHQGIDIAGPHQWVRSTASGKVFRAGYERGLGLFVMIDHGNSYQTIYGHLALITCTIGQQVLIGERIGILGKTGQATGLHLHYAVRKSGEYVDPGAYLTIGLKSVARHQLVNP